MRKFLFLLFITFSAVLKANSFCTSNLYLNTFGGLNFYETKDTGNEVSTGYAVGTALGYKFNFFRLEAEIAYRQNQIRSMAFYDSYDGTNISFPGNGSIKKISCLTNGLVDFPFSNRWATFFGIGIGYRLGRGHFESSDVFTYIYPFQLRCKIKEYGFTYQGIAGLSYKLSEKFHASLEYRHFSGIGSWSLHTVDLGIKRFF